MKCLCCKATFEDQYSLREHYVTQHGVDKNNDFLRKLFTKERFFATRNCFCCKHFYLNRRDEKNHNFLAIISKEAVALLRISLLREGTLMKIWTGFA